METPASAETRAAAAAPSEGVDWRMYQPLVLIFTLGVLLTVGIMMVFHQREQKRLQFEFNKLAEDRSKLLQRAADGCMEILNSTADLYASSERVDPDEFHLFAVRAMRRHTETVHLEWLPRLYHAQRVFFERELRAFPRGFRITQIGTNGLPTPDKPREEYFPAVYVEPVWERRQKLGFNHYSEPVRKAAMDLARDSGLPAATPWIKMSRRSLEEPEAVWVQVYLAVFTNGLPSATREQRRHNLAGFLAASLQVDRLVSKAVPLQALEDLDLVVAEQSLADEPRSTFFFTRDGWTSQMQSLEQARNRYRGKISWEGVVDLAGQPWTVVCFPTKKFLASRRSPETWIILGLALLFTVFLVNYQRVIVQRAAYVERLVGLRTAELKTQIANRLRAEEELARERDLFHTLLDNLPDRIYFKDRQSRFLRINAAMARLFGLKDPAEALGKSDFDYFTEEHARPAFEDEQEIIRTGEPLIGRVELETLPDGKTGWAHTIKMPLRDKQGNIVGTFGISRDITALKQMEERLIKANADLQKSHEELKAAQMQLIQAEKMQSVGRLAAGVAHEVKNPLAILGMGIDYLGSAAGQNDPNVAAIIEDMRAAIRRADNIILGLLDFSAPRDLQLQALSLNEIIEQALVLTKHEQIGTLVTVERRLASGLPKISLDPNKIMQVFVNLFMNACQAMSGGGTLTVTTQLKTLQPGEIRTEAGSREAARFVLGEQVVVVYVDDTGPGIPEDKLPRVFDPFFTTKPTGEGTGLGLTVTRKIIELHGGHIAIANRPEGGARVTVWFKVSE